MRVTRKWNTMPEKYTIFLRKLFARPAKHTLMCMDNDYSENDKEAFVAEYGISFTEAERAIKALQTLLHQDAE